jgi:gamma-glutamyl:cysteine ligase YbdK (ATP-grasp superfamily)
MPLFYWNGIPKHLLPQLIESAVVMVSHVSEGLSRLLADLRQRATVKEVQAQSFTLIFRQGFEHLAQTITPKNRFGGIIALCGRYSDQVNGVTFDLHSRIELAAGEVAAPVYRPVVGHLDNPGAG